VDIVGKTFKSRAKMAHRNCGGYPARPDGGCDPYSRMPESTQQSVKAAKDSRRTRHATIVFGVVVTGLVIVLWDFIGVEWHARDAEREVVTFANSVTLGSSREAVAERFSLGRFQYLTRGGNADDAQWFFQTPLRMGAKDWIVIVGFDRDRVASVRVATSDNPRRRPEGAPADRVGELPR
jgi:hypothetical protein